MITIRTWVKKNLTLMNINIIKNVSLFVYFLKQIFKSMINEYIVPVRQR